MDSGSRSYRDLQQHLDRAPVGYPATESGADIMLLQHLFTPEEACIATHLSTIRLESAARIHRRVRRSGIEMTLDELRQTLDDMVRKGTLLVYSEGFPERRYKNSGVTAGGIVDFQVNRLTKELVDTFDRYHKEQFARAETTGSIGIPQLRTIPVERSIPVTEKHAVSTYDDVRWLIEHAPGPFAVANCVCRQTKDIQGKPCRYSDIRETCLQIGTDHARQYVEMGIGRYITKEEAFQILDRAQEAGFILQPENSLRPADLYASNYHAAVDMALCTGCGTCVTRCQLEARELVGGISVVDLDRCIGCGNCVVTCKSGAARMRRKEQQLVPFEDKATMYMNIMARKTGWWSMLLLRTRMLLGMRV